MPLHVLRQHRNARYRLRTLFSSSTARLKTEQAASGNAENANQKAGQRFVATDGTRQIARPTAMTAAPRYCLVPYCDTAHKRFNSQIPRSAAHLCAQEAQ